MLESELRIEVLDAFSALTQALATLSVAIHADSQLIGWVNQQAPNQDVRTLSSNAFGQLHYTDDQEPREIMILAGFLAASANTLEQAQRVNQAKERFKQSILALKQAKIPPTDPALMQEFSQIIIARAPNTAITLKKLGLIRLHLKQCYRKIPILDAAPIKISWTWAHTKAIKKISVMQAQQMLAKRGNDSGIQIQLQKLAALNPKESLAIVQELAPHLRANLVFSDTHSIKRSMIKGPLPILFPGSQSTPFPQFSPPGVKCDKLASRSKRSDVKLEELPYLPAIRAHRYLA